MRTAESSVAEARATDHASSLGRALAVAACPIALWIGDLAAAEHYVEMLLDHSTRHALARWRAFGRCYQGMLAIQRGDVDTGLRLLRDDFRRTRRSRVRRAVVCVRLTAASGRAGQIADGLAAIEEAIVRSEHTEERWVIAELLRIKGELLLLQGAPGAAAAAEDHFRQALDWTHRQGALSWELRTAIEPRAAVARPASRYGGAGAAGIGLRPLHRRFRDRGPATGKKLAEATRGCS